MDDDSESNAGGVRKDKAPFPYYGGKQYAAPLIWEALGDPAHYVEPFFGSGATLLLRPALCNRTYYSETVNDASGLLVNAWRAIQMSPDATADAASWPVSEADLMARHLACLAWSRNGESIERLSADPAWHDPTIAGYWLYGMSAWIGGGWCSGDGPWIVGADGRITKQDKGTREPGVSRQLPHLGDDGRGVHRPQLREPGVNAKLPHLSDDGRGVHRPQLREPGVRRKLPHLANDGQGVHRPQLREPGVSLGTPERPWEPEDFHPLTMPELRAWFRFLSARLRHVRILNGDWRRACTTGAVQTLPVRSGKGHAGIFLDPPYAGSERAMGLYEHDSADIAADVRAWCAANGDNPRYRIVLAGFAGEGHEELETIGWRCIPWFVQGFLRGGMGNQKADGHQQHRERLWLSPHCAVTSAERPEEELPLFRLLSDGGDE